jgi:hypothetical protein
MHELTIVLRWMVIVGGIVAFAVIDVVAGVEACSILEADTWGRTGPPIETWQRVCAAIGYGLFISGQAWLSTLVIRHELRNRGDHPSGHGR